MEPEHRADDLLADEPRPVAALHVQQLVPDHGALDVRRPIAQRSWQEDDWPEKAKRRGLGEALDISDVRVGADDHLQIALDAVRARRITGPPQAAEPRESDEHPR